MEQKNIGSLGNQIVAKRPKHRLGRFLKKTGKPFRLTLGLAFLFLVGFLIWVGVRQSSHFTIQKIEVGGSLKHLSEAQIIEASQVAFGTNLFQLSLKKIEQNILKLPWVESASVRRQIPSTLWIYVMERKPKAILLDSRLYFVSEEGVAFKEVEHETTRDLPVITGFNKNDSLLDTIQLIHFFEGNPHFEVFGLSEIHYNDATGFSIVTLFGPMEIRLGREEFERKITRLQTIWTELGPRLGRVKGIDLDYEDRAFIKL